MDLANLVQMANRIGDFFAAQPDRAEALLGIAEHLRKFWAPPMRRELLAAIDAGQAAGLSDIVAAAIAAHRAALEPKAA
jgi:formate dehydrogenase subunit delta